MCGLCRSGRRGFLGAGVALAATLAMPMRARAASALPVVMLDPGHGGHDPGASAPDGVKEKHITLACAQTLRKALEGTGRYQVEMTRTRDVFVTLEDRVAKAVAAHADLFLAMHCDHLPEADMRGASVFTLSNNASDGLAAALAQTENSADGAGTKTPSGMSPAVASIMASLETRATRIGSATLAQDIEASFHGVIPLLPDPHRSANFAVLRDPSTPSTLLEMGCLTNKLDETLLRSAKHRDLLAARLVTAIDIYFADYAAGRAAG